MTIGRWGITRDSGGNLAALWEWPWYWRYPCGLTLAAAALAAGFWLLTEEKSQWLAAIIAGSGVLFALVSMYELGCFVLVLAFFGAIWWGATLAFPDLKFSDRILAIIGIASAWYAWSVAADAKRSSQALERSLSAIRSQLQDIEQGRSSTNEDVYERIALLKGRIRDIERANDPNSYL